MRSSFTTTVGLMGVLGATAFSGAAQAEAKARPNIILMMADDMGYGDTGFNGNKIIKTPHLDTMAKSGAILTNFHSGGSTCSPTRGTCLTGRHYYRYGIYNANVGHLPQGEITIPEILKEQGYATGHFGKWHLGTLSKTLSAKGAKRKPEANYSTPAMNGYDRSFVVESAPATWDPGYGKRAMNNPFYDDGVALEPNGENNLKGGAAKVVMDRAIPFIKNAVDSDTPFFAAIWFNAPHEDVLAGPEYLKMYSEYPENARHYYGCITELDEQVGRLRQELKKLGVADNTMLWFTSDNGPAGKKEGEKRLWGNTDGLRGRKFTLFEGGVRVPSLVEWPGHVQPGTVNKTLMSTLDYFPTLQKLVGYEMPDARPIDGVSLLDIIEGKSDKRSKPIPFRSSIRSFGSTQTTVMDGSFKLCSNLSKDGKGDMLFDLSKDRSEENNMIGQYPEKAAEMRKFISAFLLSAKKSHRGGDYNDPSFKPVDPWKEIADIKVPGKKKSKGKK